MLIGLLEDATVLISLIIHTLVGGRTAFAPYDNLSAGSKYTYVADPYTGTDSLLKAKLLHN